ncbi:MAG: phosphate ABC transporter substrate-binding/OmpA family protein [Eubacteriaceae bacterium]|nr:phosphate ABC transporter substrate-binding/OmpA family protein [Eubacteriaceae bacterium]
MDFFITLAFIILAIIGIIPIIVGFRKLISENKIVNGVLLLVAGAIALSIAYDGLVAGSMLDQIGTSNNSVYSKLTPRGSKEGTLTISLDEWHGFKPVLDANRGIGISKKGSIYRQLGLDVDIVVINNDEEGLQALIDNKVVAIGQSVNELPYVQGRLEAEGISSKMVLFTDKSLGADAIVTTSSSISSIEDLVGQNVVVGRDSAGHVMLEYFMKVSSLSNEQINDIRRNMIYASSTEEAYDILAKGRCNVAALWEPLVTKAQIELDASIVISTKSGSNLMIDGILFREDYINKYPESVKKFIEGTLQAANELQLDFSYIREFEDYKDMEIEEMQLMQNSVQFTNFADNKQLFNEIAPVLYQEMAEVWQDDLLRVISKSGHLTAFDSSYLLEIEAAFQNDNTNQNTFSEKERELVKDQDALLSVQLNVEFEPGSANIQSESYKELNDFANTAKILSSTYIAIEGNSDSSGIRENNQALSEERARSVMLYLQAQGISSERFLKPIGNGDSKPIADNNTSEGRAKNRRTEVYFKAMER